jgi:hypothetical protein
VHLDPKLTHGPLRRPVELADQAVQAFVPARAVARGLADLAEGERAEFRVIHALSSGIHVVEVGFQRAEASGGPGGGWRLPRRLGRCAVGQVRGRVAKACMVFCLAGWGL